MTTNEEKIKAFLNDEEKVRELANDEEFIGKVSGGTATPETYQKEFKKFDIELSDQDATQTKNVVDKVFEKSAEKLDDKFLKEVSGGIGVYEATGILTIGSFVSSLGCSIASCVYISKANKERENLDKYNDYINKAKNCGIAGVALLGVTGINGLITHVSGMITALSFTNGVGGAVNSAANPNDDLSTKTWFDAPVRANMSARIR